MTDETPTPDMPQNEAGQANRTGSASESEQLTVLSSPGPSAVLANEYNRLLLQSLAEHVDIRDFSWRRSLLSRYDVLHVHWPDALLHARNRFTSVGKRVALALLLVRARFGLARIVWTVHNPEPHERPARLDRLLLRAFERSVHAEVHLTEQTRRQTARIPNAVIPHGVYSKHQTKGRRQPGRLACIGHVRPYKGIDLLVTAFADHTAEGHLIIAGEPMSRAYRDVIDSAALSARGVELRLRHQTDEELAEIVTTSSGVVVPYRKFANSGVVLLALTYQRPVLVPRNRFSEELVNEFGSEWVHTFEPPIDPDDIDRFITTTERLPDHGPDLSKRQWAAIAREHHSLYRAALESRR